MNVEIGAEAMQFPEKEYINGIAVAFCRKNGNQSIYNKPVCVYGSHGNNYLCTYYLYSHVHNVLDACISITWASGRGMGPGI
jgi:hypothetical protein